MYIRISGVIIIIIISLESRNGTDAQIFFNKLVGQKKLRDLVPVIKPTVVSTINPNVVFNNVSDIV